MKMIALGIILLVAFSRLAELAYAKRNESALRARGAVEWGASHYRLFFILHGSWLLAMFVLLPDRPSIDGMFLTLFFCFFTLRIWVIVTLGPYWTTRILTIDEALVTKGPYRFVRHPNYLAVAGEIATLPLAFGQWRIALVFTLLNAALLALRIRTEEKALQSRR